jgi:Domain of unknown function (DUF4124)
VTDAKRSIPLKTFTIFLVGLCLSVLLGLALAAPGQAEEYYTYKDPNGGLVISNKMPPTGSIVLKRLELPEPGDPHVQPSREGSATPLNAPSEGSAKPSKNQY